MTRCRRPVLAAALLAVTAIFAGGAVASADSFTPVRLGVTVASKVKRRQPLAIKVKVSADKGALDRATAPLWLRVKLAGECGGTFSGTPGIKVLDRRLKPQPHRGSPYTVTVKGSVRPERAGRMTVCVFLEEQGDHRVFADDTSAGVNVVRSR
jgi:hypothetical protein